MHHALRRFFLVLFAVAVLAGSWAFHPGTAARAQVQQGLTRALASFAAARALGGVLAVAAGTGVTVQPLGVGVALAPGRILEPLREMVDQCASVLLAASVAFGIQLLLLSIGAHPAVALALSAAVLAWLLLQWQPRRGDGRLGRAVSSVLLALLLARFAVPLAAWGHEAVFRAVMAGEHAQAVATVQRSGREIDAAQAAVESPQDAAGEHWLDRMRRKLPAVPNPAAAFERMQRTAEAAVEQMVRLVAVFAVQTVVLPLLFLWMLARAGGWLLGAAPAIRRAHAPVGSD
jgi:hypothetical protein